MKLFGVAILLVIAGGLGAVLAGRRPRVADALFGMLVVAGCAAAAFVALRALTGPAPPPLAFIPRLPGGVWEVAIDALSAWFLLLLSFVGGVATLFGIPYLAGERAHRPVAAAHATWALLLAAMMGVVVARSAMLFLLTWEAMAVSAYFLIMFEHEHDEVRRSGLLYLVLTHAGTLALLVMFLTWGQTAGGLTFANFAASSGRLPFGGAAVLLLALFGFGIKAGAVPFHFWLPGAHASAPSHVSALLSGVMLKVGIYGLFRVVTLVGAPPAWWGWVILLLGLASAILGVLWALAQRDLKRLLAYSSVENIGIILMGLGLGVLGSAYHRPAVELLGYTGALLHTLNHALFKSLLFLGAGSIAYATGTREIDRLGGLARRMPRTALLFLAGSVAIVGLPPLNGFVSEWLLVRGFQHAGASGGLLRFAILGAAGLALVGGLALACFTRLVGVAFLGAARDRSIDGVRDASIGLVAPMAILAVACVGLGLAPGVALRGLERAIVILSGAPAPGTVEGILLRDATGGLPLLAAACLVLGLAAWSLHRLLVRRAPQAIAATWGCAFGAVTPRMQYTAASYSAALLGTFPGAGPRVGARVPRETRDIVLRRFVHPSWDRIRALAAALRPLQQGRVTTYLQYMIWTLLLLLGFLMAASPGGRS